MPRRVGCGRGLRVGGRRLGVRLAGPRPVQRSEVWTDADWRLWAGNRRSQPARLRLRGSKDGAFNQEISELVGQTRVSRTNWQTGAMAGRTFSVEDIAIIRPEEIRQPWPAKGRYTRHTAEASRRAREDRYAADLGSLRPAGATGRRRPRLGLVDLDTGEINDL